MSLDISISLILRILFPFLLKSLYTYKLLELFHHKEFFTISTARSNSEVFGELIAGGCTGRYLLVKWCLGSMYPNNNDKFTTAICFQMSLGAQI